MNTFWPKTFFLLLLFILLFCSYRLLTWGITPCDELLYRGLLAKDIIDGLKAPLSEYTITPYSNDTHFLGIVSVPFFLLFGDSFLTLYVVTMILPLCTLIGLYFFASKYFSPRVACVSCYIYVLAPFMYVHDNVYTSGLHADTAFFTLFLLYCFYNVFFSPVKKNVYFGIDNNKQERRTVILLFIFCGVLSGIACYLCLAFLAPLTIFLFFWFFFDPQLYRKRYLYIFGISFFISFFPRIMNIFYLHEESLNISSYTAAQGIPLWRMFFGQGNQVGISLTFLHASLKQFFSVTTLSDAFDFFIPPDLFYYIVLVSMAAAGFTMIMFIATFFIRMIKKKRNARQIDISPLKEVIIFSYVLLVVMLWLLHPDVWPDDIYLAQAYPFVALLMGILVDKLWKMRWRVIKMRTIGLTFLIIILVSGFVYFYDAIKTYAVEDIRKAYQIKGYSLELDPMFSTDTYADFLREDLFNFAKFVRNYNDEHMNTLYNTIREAGLKQYSFNQRFSLLDQMNPSLRALVCINLGLVMGDGLSNDTMPRLALQLGRVLNKTYHHYFYEGIALSYCNRLYTEVVTAIQEHVIEYCIPSPYRHYFYLEFGRRIAEKYKQDLYGGMLFLRTFSSVYHGFLYQGFISALTEDEMRELLTGMNMEHNNLLKKYVYYHKGEFIGDFIIVPSDNNIDKNYLANSLAHIPPAYGIYYIWGVINQAYTRQFSSYGRDFSGIAKKEEKAYNTVPLYTLREIVETVSSYTINQQSMPFVYQGLGLSVSIRTFGELSYFNSVDTLTINDIISHQYRDYFFEGYGIGLALRYGNDQQRVTELIAIHIPPVYHDIVLAGWHRGLEYLSIDTESQREE